jgi:hypothetical protein
MRRANRSRLARIALCATLVGALQSTSGPASAQQPCVDEVGIDAFRSARRARRILADYEQLESYYTRDLVNLDPAYMAMLGELPEHRVAFSPVVETTAVPDMRVCTTDGSRSSTLSMSRFALFGEYTWRKWDVGLRAFYVRGIDSMSFQEAAGFEVPEGEEDANGTIQFQQGLLGARLMLTEWSAVTIGRIRETSIRTTPAIDGATVPPDVFPAESTEGASSDRLYLAVEVPRWGLGTDILLDPRDERLDTLSFGIDDLPIPGTPIRGDAFAGYIEDEDQIVTSVAVSKLLRFFEIGAGVEYRPFRLRHARFRVEVSSEGIKGQAPEGDEAAEPAPGAEPAPESDAPEAEGDSGAGATSRGPSTRGDAPGDEPPGPDERPAERREGAFELRVYLDTGLFWEGTVFNSRYLEEQTGRSWVWGAAGGGWFGVSGPVMSIYVELSVGANRPRLLERISETVGRGDFHAQLNWRIGW